MPIGMPVVPYRLPGDPTAQWIDIYQRLYREGIMFLCQELDDELANQLMGIMVYLNEEDELRDLFLYINSPGGSVVDGIALYDMINYLTADVTTIASGSAASMASFVLTGGTIGKRIALPNSRIMIHQPEGGSKGATSEILFESDEVLRVRRQVGVLYAERTGQTLDTICRDMDRDQFMSAQEAKEYGLVDRVVTHYDEL